MANFLELAEPLIYINIRRKYGQRWHICVSEINWWMWELRKPCGDTHKISVMTSYPDVQVSCVCTFTLLFIHGLGKNHWKFISWGWIIPVPLPKFWQWWLTFLLLHSICICKRKQKKRRAKHAMTKKCNIFYYIMLIHSPQELMDKITWTLL